MLKLKITVLALFSLFSFILNRPIREIGMDNFMDTVRNTNDTQIWIVAVVNRTDVISKEFLTHYEKISEESEVNYARYGLVDLSTENGRDLFHGVETKLPEILLFDDLNPTWDYISQGRIIELGELKTLIGYSTKNVEIIDGKKMKRDKSKEKDDL